MGLLRLMPGVRYEDSSEALGEDFGTLIPQVGGQRRHWNSVSVDGLLGNEASGSNRMSSAINLDAIEEVKVLLNTFKAEFGRSGGANIQIVTKSGGADYRGSATTTRGATPGTRRDGRTTDRTSPSRNTTSIPTAPTSADPSALPGLWSQDDKKLFFFYSLEAPRGQRPPGPIRRYRLPTELERRGDFSQTRDQQGRPDLHPRSAAQRHVQHPDRRRRAASPATSSRPIASTPTARSLLEHLPAAEPHRSRIDRPQLSAPGDGQASASQPGLASTDWKPTSNSRYFSTLRTVLVQADRLGDHRRSARLGLVRRHLRVQRQLDQRWLEPGDRRADRQRPDGRLRTPHRRLRRRRGERLARLRKVGRRLHARASSIPSSTRSGSSRAPTSARCRRPAATAWIMNYPDRIGDTAVD